MSSESIYLEQGQRLGANQVANGSWEFRLWAPYVRKAAIHFLGSDERIVQMEPEERGYHSALVQDQHLNAHYLYRLDGSRELPDPASRLQPLGVHGPSQATDESDFQWNDKSWKGIELESSIFYELHVGTYTEQGTFGALESQLDDLVKLGVTTVELMPVAQFPGSRNWGYDGVFPFAPQNSYGGPAGLRSLVNTAHERGLAVALDVVYNHLGPEGNYLSAYAPYFTNRYQTPWGEAINFDGPGSDEVRRFFIENALYWLEVFHIDVLRLDAVHGIFDFSARHFLSQLKASVHDQAGRLGRQIHLIGESDLNDSRLLRPSEGGGFGLDAQWSDDFHHSVHTLLTGEKDGYYSDFGKTKNLASTLKNGWCYSGQYSEHRGRRHGNSAAGIAASRFVVCTQNHDQIGNRAAGERLSALVSMESLKLAAGTTLLAPYVPLLFMGEEYGETAPFQYFTSHGDRELVEAVRRGRQKEFQAFGWKGAVPDPQDENTFIRSRLHAELKQQEPHATLLRLYRELIRIRRQERLGKPASWQYCEVGDAALFAKRGSEAGELAMVFNFAKDQVSLNLEALKGSWTTLIYSADSRWNGPVNDFTRSLSKPFALQLHPESFAVFKQCVAESEAE